MGTIERAATGGEAPVDGERFSELEQRNGGGFGRARWGDRWGDLSEPLL